MTGSSISIFLAMLLLTPMWFASAADDPGYAPIQHVEVGQPLGVSATQGDTWSFAWAGNGEIYSPANDGKGFGTERRNIAFNRISGNDPKALTGQVTVDMAEYGPAGGTGADHCSWKSSGCVAVDGVLYLVVARHLYGEVSGDVYKRQPAQNSSIIKSADGGKTWTRTEKENYDKPMFPGNSFATPYFVNYGQDGREVQVDGGDRYVYAMSNDGFWDNGDTMILGRVPRAKIGELDADDWQFWSGGNGSQDKNWVTKPGQARPVISEKGKLASTGPVYLPVQKCYFLVAWYYPMGGGKMPNACTETRWDFYTARHPWGPWTQVGEHTFSPEAYYCPQVCPKFTSADGKTLYVVAAGDWHKPACYRLTLVPLRIQ